MDTETNEYAKVLIGEDRAAATLAAARAGIVDCIKASAPRSEKATYRVMQYNILRDGDHWGWEYITVPGTTCDRRVELICAAVEGYHPDLLGLCERFDGWNDLADIENRLAAYGYAFAESPLPEAMYVTYPTKHDDRHFNRCPLVYDTNVFEVVKSDVIDIQAFPSINYRVVTSVLLRDKRTGQEIAAFVTHWESGQIVKDGQVIKNYSECRVLNAERMNQAIDCFLAGRAKVPAVAMGDFNSHLESKEFQTLLSGSGMTDGLGIPGVIDHIACRNCRVIASGRDTAPYTGYASDHKPIYCDIQIGG